MNTSTTFERVSIEELNPTGWEDFTDCLFEGRTVVTAPGGSDTIPCPPPEAEEFPY
jgi:ABC-type Fe3+ transport system substrate-binding protein